MAAKFAKGTCSICKKVFEYNKNNNNNTGIFFVKEICDTCASTARHSKDQEKIENSKIESRRREAADNRCERQRIAEENEETSYQEKRPYSSEQVERAEELCYDDIRKKNNLERFINGDPNHNQMERFIVELKNSSPATKEQVSQAQSQAGNDAELIGKIAIFINGSPSYGEMDEFLDKLKIAKENKIESSNSFVFYVVAALCSIFLLYKFKLSDGFVFGAIWVSLFIFSVLLALAFYGGTKGEVSGKVKWTKRVFLCCIHIPLLLTMGFSNLIHLPTSIADNSEAINSVDNSPTKTTSVPLAETRLVQEADKSPALTTQAESVTKEEHRVESNTLSAEDILKLEDAAKYHGDDPIVRARLGLPPKQ